MLKDWKNWHQEFAAAMVNICAKLCRIQALIDHAPCKSDKKSQSESIRVEETDIPGVLIVDAIVYGDERGFFLESYNESQMQSIGIDAHFVQDNHSRSQRNVLRGLHYQIHQPQGKLVRVVSGAVFDVVVDIRRNSPSFGKWVGVELSEKNKRMLWIPPGLAHGFVVLSDTADFLYKATDYYAPKYERSILWNDPSIGIEWPVEHPILSAKDAVGKLLSEAEVFETIHARREAMLTNSILILGRTGQLGWELRHKLSCSREGNCHRVS